MTDFYVLFGDYLKNQKSSSENTCESYLRDVAVYLNFLKTQNHSPTDADEATVNRFITFLKGINRTVATISRNLASIRCFYKFLVFQGFMEINPAKSIKIEKATKKLPHVLTSAEIENLLSCPDITEPKGCRDKAMLELLCSTGIRVSELINLNIKDINLRTGMLHCNGAKSVRSIPVYPAAIVAVSDYIYRMRGVITGPDSGSALFVNLNGGRLTRQGFWKIIKGYANEAGIMKEITPHVLRHSFAINNLENGASVKDIQTMMGHADISSTQVYLQLLNSDSKVSPVYSETAQSVKLG